VKNFPAPPIYGHAYLGVNLPQSLHLTRQTKPFQPSQSNVLCTKERGDIRLQTNILGLQLFLIYIAPPLKIWWKKIAWNHGK